MPQSKAAVDGLARTLVDAMRSQADERINRLGKFPEKGRVASVSPVRIIPDLHEAGHPVLEAGDIFVPYSEPLVVGQVVLIMRTISDDIFVIPMISGNDYQPWEERRTGTEPGDATATPSDPTYGTGPHPDGPNSDRVIQSALFYLGKTPSDQVVKDWSAAWGFSSVPAWCAIFADAMYKIAVVDDENIGNPSVGTIVTNGQTKGRIESKPVKGCFVCRGSEHVMLYIGGPTHSADIVGGNQGNRPGVVSRGIRDISDCTFVVPAALHEATSGENVNTGTGAAPGNYTRNYPSGWSPEYT